MPITCEVQNEVTYGKNDTVDHENLNKHGEPTVEVPDGGKLSFARVTIQDGTAQYPALAFRDEDGTGWRRSAARRATFGIWDQEESAANDVVTLCSDGVEIAEGSSLTFQNHHNYGLKWDGGMVGFGPDGNVFRVTNKFELFKPVKITAPVDVTGKVTIEGDLDVSGKFSATINTMASGKVDEPGLPQQADAKTGLYKPGGGLGSAMGLAANGQVGVMVHRAPGQKTVAIVGRTPGAVARFDDVVLYLDYEIGDAAINFNGGHSTGGATITLSNAPVAGQAIYIPVKVGATLGYLPILPR